MSLQLFIYEQFHFRPQLNPGIPRMPSPRSAPSTPTTTPDNPFVKPAPPGVNKPATTPPGDPRQQSPQVQHNELFLQENHSAGLPADLKNLK